MMLCNAQHEKFARAVAAGRNASQAYRDAGFAPHRQNASRLMTHDDIKRRIAELKEQREPDSKNGRDPQSGQFLLGHKSNDGRPRGSRNLLAEKFIADLHDEWQRSGATALQRVAQSDPTAFVRVVAGVLPSKIDATLSIDTDFLREVMEFSEAWRIVSADEPQMIELQPQVPHDETEGAEHTERVDEDYDPQGLPLDGEIR